MKQCGSPIRSSERGFSLIEVLIAVLILGIGLLGAAAMQILSLQNASNAELRTQATLFAQELTELARTSSAPGDFAKTGATDDCSTLSGQIKGWCESMAHTLPGSSFEVTWNATEGDLSTTITWPERIMFLPAAYSNTNTDGEGTSSYTLLARFPL